MRQGLAAAAQARAVSRKVVEISCFQDKNFYMKACTQGGYGNGFGPVVGNVYLQACGRSAERQESYTSHERSEHSLTGNSRRHHPWQDACMPGQEDYQLAKNNRSAEDESRFAMHSIHLAKQAPSQVISIYRLLP